MIQLTGRVVVITGGARGIGMALAQAFAATGAKVAIGDIDPELADQTATRLGCLGGALDVTDPVAFDAFLDMVEARLGPIDVLVNNAGIMPVTKVLDETAESIRRQLAVNTTGVIFGTQLAARRMTTRGTGHIVNIASAAGKMAFGGVATYSASKFAVAGFTDAVALELRSSGIYFTCVMPGVVNTELTSGLRDHWLLRACQPEDVAAAVIAAVRRGRRAVYVPRRLRAVVWGYGLLPSAARTKVMAMMGADHQMLDGDVAARHGYQSRIGT